MFQMKEKDKNMQKLMNEIKRGNVPEKEFKKIVVNMI